MGHFEIDPEEFEALVIRHMPTTSKMEKLAVLVHAQVDARFVTQGASGGESWPPVKLPPKAGSPSLEGVEKSFEHRGFAGHSGGEAEVSSSEPFIKTHQFGATIVPKRAKALWIPISERAKSMRRSGLAPVMHISKGEFKGLRMPIGLTGELVKGKDFIFASKAEIPKRPMLPDSPQERDAAIRYVLKLLVDPNG